MLTWEKGEGGIHHCYTSACTLLNALLVSKGGQRQLNPVSTCPRARLVSCNQLESIPEKIHRDRST